LIYLLVAAVVFFIIIFLLFKVIKDAIKVAALASTVLILIVIFGSLLIYLDAKDLRANMENSFTTILLVDDNLTIGRQVISGFKIRLSNTSEIIPFNDSVMNSVNKNYVEENFNTIKGSSYKVIIFDRDSLANILPELIILERDAIKTSKLSNSTNLTRVNSSYTSNVIHAVVDGANKILDNEDSQNSDAPQNSARTLSKEAFFNIMDSSRPIDSYIQYMLDDSIVGLNDDSTLKRKFKESITSNKNFNDDSKFKAMLYSIAFENILYDSPESIVKEYKKDKVIIYPETVLLKIIKIVPDDFLKKQFESLKNKIKENIQKRTALAINQKIGNLTA
jgi:hypothetical protein